VSAAPVDPATANPGTSHICLFVEDLDSLYERLHDQGVEFISRPQTSESGRYAGGRVVYLKDPDGIRVELLERPAASLGELRGGEGSR
jgi:catechol 2,3-dioxygenase-like lactoylglutathione lyase family enzyme